MPCGQKMDMVTGILGDNFACSSHVSDRGRNWPLTVGDNNRSLDHIGRADDLNVRIAGEQFRWVIFIGL